MICAALPYARISRYKGQLAAKRFERVPGMHSWLSLSGALVEAQRYTAGSSIWTASMYRVAEIVSMILGVCIVPATIAAGLLFLANF